MGVFLRHFLRSFHHKENVFFLDSGHHLAWVSRNAIISTSILLVRNNVMQLQKESFVSDHDLLKNGLLACILSFHFLCIDLRSRFLISLLWALVAPCTWSATQSMMHHIGEVPFGWTWTISCSLHSIVARKVLEPLHVSFSHPDIIKRSLADYPMKVELAVCL